MTKNELEEWLRRGRFVSKEIKLIETRIKEENDRVTSITSSLDAVVVQGTKDPHKFDRLCELTDELWTQHSKLTRIRAEIQSGINKLDDSKQRQVMSLYYVDGRSIHRIAEYMNYSDKAIYYIRRNARKKLREIL